MMLSKEQVQKLCKEVGIHEKAIVLGKGCKCSKGRYIKKASTLNEDNLYVVQYCKDIDYYVAWDVSRAGVPKREVFSIMSKLLDNINDNKINSLTKAVEYSGWNSEIVLVFKPRFFQQFLTEYVLKRVNN